MSAAELLQGLSWLLYLLIFLVVLVRAVRLPTPAHADMALFFGDTAAIVLLGAAAPSVPLLQTIWISDLSGALLMALPYLLLRLVQDFSRVPAWIMYASAIGLGLSIAAIVGLPTPMPTLPALILVSYFLALTVYDAVAFSRQATRSVGVTRRRMHAIAGGTVCLAGVLFLAGATVVNPERGDLWQPLSQVVGLVSGVAYFIGFAPPTWLRRAWQEPDVGTFLARAASIAELPDTPSAVRSLEAAAAQVLGAPAATIGLWHPEIGRLRFGYGGPRGPDEQPHVDTGTFILASDGWEADPNQQPVSGRTFLDQRARLIADVRREDPATAALYTAYNARAALTAPITAGETRLGVLVVYAPNAPVFAHSDLELVELIAMQAAVVLQNRALVEEAARVRARGESMRLKEDFLSSAAHDLKTPLTGILTQAQLLDARADCNPLAPADRAGIQRVVREARRLRTVVAELLDAAEMEPSGEEPQRVQLDLVDIARELCGSRPRCEMDGDESVVGAFDPVRMRQLLGHLLDNALTYDPTNAPVHVRLWSEGGDARISVVDTGIGIAPEDLPHVFDRFHRGRNVDDRRFAGLGLGLYLCRRIAESHGGRISVESELGRGTRFDVWLPNVPASTRAVSEMQHLEDDAACA